MRGGHQSGAERDENYFSAEITSENPVRRADQKDADREQKKNADVSMQFKKSGKKTDRSQKDE